MPTVVIVKKSEYVIAPVRRLIGIVIIVSGVRGAAGIAFVLHGGYRDVWGVRV